VYPHLYRVTVVGVNEHGSADTLTAHFIAGNGQTARKAGLNRAKQYGWQKIESVDVKDMGRRS
jgi:hypothetical protein